MREPIPPIQINTNINVVGMEKKQDESLEVPFVLSITFNPSIAQMSIKGTAYAQRKSGNRQDAEGLHQKKPPAQIIIQSISTSFIESVLISRILNIPPPIPLPQIPETGKPPSSNQKEETTANNNLGGLSLKHVNPRRRA